MNLKGKKSIEYSDESWNPYSGCLILDCAVKSILGRCWAERMAFRLKGRFGYNSVDPFISTFHEDKLHEPLKWRKPRRIVVSFMGDIGYCKREWMLKILHVVSKTPQHRYYFLSKYPRNFQDYIFPKNAWVGTTVNLNKDLYRIRDLQIVNASIKFVSFEPIYENIILGDTIGIHWFILGAQTNPEFQPRLLWVKNLIDHAQRSSIPVFLKDNLKWLPRFNDFPEGLGENK